MYLVKCDGFKIYDSRLEKYPITSTSLELELNKTGSFAFTIYPTHPHFDKLYKMKSIITVEQDGELIFRGRILNEEQGFYNEKRVICEGELAFLLDSIIRPYGSEDAPWEGTPAEYFTKLLNEHNAQVEERKRFKVGTVTVTDGDTSNTENKIQRSDSEYKTTWDLINEKLIGPLGGYLWVRRESDGIYLDYLSDLNIQAEQRIEFGKNLLDLKKSIKGEEVMTAIIPLGAKNDVTGQRLTLKDGGAENDYLVNEEAVENLGYIFKTVIWDDVTDPGNLRIKAEAHLANAVKFSGSIEFTAADLNGITGVNPFRLGRKIEVRDKYHDLEELKEDEGPVLKFLISKVSLDLLQETNNKLTVGTTFKTFTESTTGVVAEQGKIAEKVDTIARNISENGITQDQLHDAINVAKIELTEQNGSSISQSANEIMTQVAQEYYLKDDASALVQSISTQFTQTENEFDFRFNEFSQNINDVAAGADAQFSEINRYIRFINGNIVLGEEGNELTLRIQNDRISFLESGAEVAYLSNRKLYVTDGEYLQSLKIGNYAFIPRANGNISFKKVT